MARVDRNKLREKILKGRGLVVTRTRKSTTRSLAHRPHSVPESMKTYAMKAFELKFGIPIETILVSGSLSIIKAKYGIDRTTACRWRRRLGLS